jgi:multidrug efflux pump subunit AcrA (membrane-fusion protein)
VKRAVKIILPLAILLSGIGVFAALKATKPQPEVAISQERVWRVEAEAVRPSTLAPQLTLYGRLETRRLLKAAAPAPARVDRILVDEGERVGEGDLLVVLDERDFLPKLAQAEAEVTELEAQLNSEEIRHKADLAALTQERKLLTLAEDAVRRARRLLTQQLGADSAVDEAEQAAARQQLAVTTREQAIADHPARIKVLEARLQRAEAGLQQVQLDLERSRITAPYPAVVASVEVAEGDQVGDNAVLLSLYSQGSLELRARIPAPYQQELQLALDAGRVLGGRAGAGEQEVGLQLARLAGEAAPSGVDALFRVERGAEWLRPGQMLHFELERPAREGLIAVPYQAIYGSDRVYTLQEGRMRGVRVEVIGNTVLDGGEERLLVSAPTLQAGDLLVVTHLPNAIDGLRAEAVEQP